MKNFIILAAFSTILIACEESAPITEKPLSDVELWKTGQFESSDNSRDNDTHLNRQWSPGPPSPTNPHDASRGKCLPPAVNCWDAIVITGPRLLPYQDFEQISELPSDKVALYFKSDKAKDLFNFLYTDTYKAQLEYLQSGSTYIHKVNDPATPFVSYFASNLPNFNVNSDDSFEFVFRFIVPQGNQ